MTERSRYVSPQPWKLEVPKELDLEEEFELHDDPTSEFLITEPDDFMDDLALEDEITEVYTPPVPLVSER